MSMYIKFALLVLIKKSSTQSISQIQYLRLNIFVMQPESAQPKLQLLPAYLLATYSSRSTRQVQKAESALKQLCQENPQQMFIALQTLINSPHTIKGLGNSSSGDGIVTAALIKLKALIYDITLPILPENTPFYLSEMYKLITKETGLTRKQRMFVANGIEYIIDKDNLSLYKPVLFSKVSADLTPEASPGCICGILLIYQAFINSQPEASDVCQLFDSSFWPLKEICAKNLQLINQNIVQVQTTKQFKSILEMVYSLFQYFEAVIMRLLDEYNETSLIVQKFRSDQDFQKIVFGYLALACKKSIILKEGIMAETINELKVVIMRFVLTAYDNTPLNIIELSVCTFMEQAGRELEKNAEQLLSNIMNLLEVLLKRPELYQYFSCLGIGLLMNGLLYLKTSFDQIQLIKDDPKRYVQQLEDSVKMFNQNTSKSKACGILQALCKTISGFFNFGYSVSNLLLQSIDDSEKEKQTIEKMKNFPVFISSTEVQLQIGLHMLCLLEPIVKEREQAYYNVKLLLAQYADKIQGVEWELVSIKYMLALGIYQVPMGIRWIKQQMQTSQAKKLQGLATINLLMKGKIQPEIVKQQFINCLGEILTMAQPTDTMFETLVLNNYTSLLLAAPKILNQCLNMIISWMLIAIQTPQYKMPQAPNIAVFNLFEGMIEHEEDTLRLQTFQRQFSKIALGNLVNTCLKDNVISVMDLFLRKTQCLSQYQRHYAARVFVSPFSQNLNNIVLLYLNKIIAFEKNVKNLKSVVDLLGNLLKQIKDETLISQIAILLGQSVARTSYFTSSIVQTIATLVQNQVEFRSTRLRLSEVILIALCSNSNEVLQIIGPFYEKFIQFPFTTWYYAFNPMQFDRKILICGFCKIIEIEHSNLRNPKVFIIQAAKILKEHSEGVKVKKKKTKENRKIRREQKSKVEVEQQSIAQESDEGISHQVQVVDSRVVDLQIAILVKYSHPIQSIDEFEFFRRKILQLKNTVLEICSPKEIDLLKEIVETFLDKSGKKTRRIVKVSEASLQ